MNAIILAAGEGKRLHPLTENKPKCLVELFGKSLLERQIETFRNLGISDITVVTGYCGEQIDFSGITYFSNPKFQTTNMVETLFCAKEKISDCVIVSYGDIIFEKNVLQKLIESEDEFSVIVDSNWEKYWKIRFKNPLEDAESLIVDNDGYITNIGQKIKNQNEIQGQYIGLMKFKGNGTKFLKNFYEKAKSLSIQTENILNPDLPFEKSYMTDLLQGLINEKCKIKSIPVRNGWLELDSYHDYEMYQKKFEDGTMSEFFSLER